MDKIKELQQLITDAWVRYMALKDETVTEEVLQKREAILDEIEGAEAEITVLERAQAFESRMAERTSDAERPGGEGGDVHDEENRFETQGEFFRAVYQSAMPNNPVIDERLVQRAASGLSAGIPSDGGFLIQTDFVTELMTRTYETGILAARCRRQPISARSNSVKIPGIDETSRATGSRMGGIRGYWESEAAEKTGSKPKFRMIELNLKKLIGLCYATDELLDDATALSAFIMSAFPEEFGFLIDDAIIEGVGAGIPLGILNSGCLVSVPKETGQAADTILAENVEKMYSRMWARGLGNAVWLINQDCWPQLFLLHHAVGTGGVPMFIPAGGLNQTPFGTLLGRPIIPIEQASTVGTVGDIILADFSQYILAEKGGIDAAVSIHVRFVYDETAFRFVMRIDGQPVWATTLTPFKGTNTVSPFVALASRD